MGIFCPLLCLHRFVKGKVKISAAWEALKETHYQFAKTDGAFGPAHRVQVAQYSIALNQWAYSKLLHTIWKTGEQELHTDISSTRVSQVLLPSSL